jgi:ACT domain-containing protein
MAKLFTLDKNMTTNMSARGGSASGGKKIEQTKNDLPIITVIGEDKPGIVAQVSALLWKKNVNIEELNQGVIKGKFFMLMAVDLGKSSVTFEQLSRELKQLGEKVGLDISLYNQQIFTAMNRI